MAANTKTRRMAFAISLLAVFLLQLACTQHLWRFRVIKAKASLRKLESAESTFKTANGRYGKLEELAAAGLITGNLAKGVDDCYRYEIRVKGDAYEALAIPDKQIDKELPAYFLDQTGVLRRSYDRTEANANDPPAPET